MDGTRGIQILILLHYPSRFCLPGAAVRASRERAQAEYAAAYEAYRAAGGREKDAKLEKQHEKQNDGKDAAGGKGKKRKRDPNMPKRASTSFACFVSRNMPKPVAILAATLFFQIERRLHLHTAAAPPDARMLILRRNFPCTTGSARRRPTRASRTRSS